MSDYVTEMIWSAAEVAAEIGKHRDDEEWIPRELKSGGYLVHDAKGNLLPPPTTKQVT